MTSNLRIPSLLEPYILTPPKDSLVLLTNTLGTSTNWLVLRFICGVLGDAASSRRKPQDGEASSTANTEDGRAVLLVSWMQDYGFWRTEARRAGGLDLNQLSRSKRFAYVDGMTTLCTPPIDRPVPRDTRGLPLRQASMSQSTLPQRSIQSLWRTPEASQSSAESQSSTAHASPSACSALQVEKLASTELSQIRDVIAKAMASLVEGGQSLSGTAIHSATQSTNQITRKRKLLLVLDAPDLLLALQPADTNTPSPSTSLHSLLLSLRLQDSVFSTILNLSSDTNPPSSTLPPNHIPTGLETESQAFLLGLAHQADLVVGCRGLDTGGAGDVSGVLRITKGDVPQDEDSEGVYGGAKSGEWKEQELLYLVRNDGSVKVWERGAGVG